MTLIRRYVLRRFASAFVAALLALTAVVWITQALRDLNVVTAKGQTLLIFLEVTSLALPTLIVVIAPFALLLAAIFVLNGMNSENETVVISASGGSRMTIFGPIFALTVVVSVAMAFMTVYALPVIQQKLRAVTLAVNVDLVANIIQPGRFVPLDEGLTFHIRNRAGDGSLIGLMIDDRRDQGETKTYLAKEAVVVEAGRTTVLVMKDGQLLRSHDDRDAQSIFQFDTYGFDLSDLQPEAQKQDAKPSERSTAELLAPDLTDPYVQRNLSRFRTELHDRLSQPLLPLAFALVAFVFLGDARTGRQSRGVSIAAVMLCALLLRVVMLAAVSASVSARGIVLLYGAPLAVIFITALLVLRDRRTGLTEFTDAIEDLAMQALGPLLRWRRRGDRGGAA